MVSRSRTVYYENCRTAYLNVSVFSFTIKQYEEANVQIKDGLVLFCAVMIMAATMGIVNVVTSLFYPIVSADLGVTRSAFALTGTITALSSMAASLFWGFFFFKTRNSARMILGIIALGLCFF